MKKYISKLIITLTLICLIQSKLPYFYFEIPSIHHIESIAPYNDIPVSGENDHQLISLCIHFHRNNALHND